LVCLESVKFFLCPVKLGIGGSQQIALFWGLNVHKYSVIARRRNQQEAEENWMRSFKVCPPYQMF